MVDAVLRRSDALACHDLHPTALLWKTLPADCRFWGARVGGSRRGLAGIRRSATGTTGATGRAGATDATDATDAAGTAGAAGASSGLSRFSNSPSPGFAAIASRTRSAPVSESPSWTSASPDQKRSSAFSGAISDARLYSTPEEAIEVVTRLRPDVTLMDIRMPVLDGLAATRQLMEAGIGTSVLVLTTFDLDEYVFGALRAGASGFLLKDVPPEQLVEGIRTVAQGEALLAPSVTRRVIDEFVRRPPPSARELPPQVAELTARELEVLRLIAKGLSNAEMAKELFVSETTVKTHVANVLTKLDVRARVQAVVLAYECGFVGNGD